MVWQLVAPLATPQSAKHFFFSGPRGNQLWSGAFQECDTHTPRPRPARRASFSPVSLLLRRRRRCRSYLAHDGVLGVELSNPVVQCLELLLGAVVKVAVALSRINLHGACVKEQVARRAWVRYQAAGVLGAWDRRHGVGHGWRGAGEQAGPRTEIPVHIRLPLNAGDPRYNGIYQR